MNDENRNKENGVKRPSVSDMWGGAQGQKVPNVQSGVRRSPLSPIPKKNVNVNVKARKKKRRKREYSVAFVRRVSAAVFAAVSLGFLVLCVGLAYSYSGESIRELSMGGAATRSSARAYRIVYSESDTWGLSAATALHDAFLEKTGASLSVVPDSEAVGLHELRIGHTNRASDDYITSVSALGENGYAVMITSGDNVNIAAFSESGATAAVRYFVTNYVGAYRHSRLTFAAHHSFTLVDRTGNEPLSSLRQTSVPLNFTETGRFRVLVLSDADINEYTVSALEAIVKSEKPQLVIFDGDVSSGMTTKAELEEYVKKLTLPLEENEIPWAVVFGEQDTDGGLDALSQTEVYSSFAHCVTKAECTSDGAVSAFLPIYPAGEVTSASVPALGIWTLGQTAMLSEYEGVLSEELFDRRVEEGSDYGFVPASHIAFFTENGKVLERETGGALRTVIVTHTPTEEFSAVALNPEKTQLFGEIGEDISSSPINSGLFAAALADGNVLGIFCGHDHLNSFVGKYCGIELGYSASIGYDGYGFGGTFDINNRLRGGRMLDFSLSADGSLSMNTRMVYARDLGIGGN